MKRGLVAAGMLTGVVALAGACSEQPTMPQPSGVAQPGFHVGYRGSEVPLGFVRNDAECHIGKRGDRWPVSEQYEVKVYDAQLVTTPSGVMVLVCSGDIPADQPRPQRTEVEQGVLCFLPNQVSTRHAQEVFTPGGKIILTCQHNPRR